MLTLEKMHLTQRTAEADGKFCECLVINQSNGQIHPERDTNEPFVKLDVVLTLLATL